MKKLLLAATVLSSLAFGTPAAQACTLRTCPGTSVVCAALTSDCRVCYYKPGGAMQCIV